MSFRLEREKTELTPYVLIDEEKGYMRFEGECYHSDVVSFFADISAWLAGFLASDFDAFTFDCALRYFNSSTVKLLLNLLLDMDNSANSRNITVNWITDKDDSLIIECGEDFQSDIKHMKFCIITKEGSGR